MSATDKLSEDRKDDAVDRQKVCPFLLRVFVSSSGQHHKIAEYHKGNTPSNELQIYTWKDATLHELTQLVKEVNPETRRKGTKFSFALVYPDFKSPMYRMREIGSTTTGIKGPDDLMTLGHYRLTLGDYMDIAIAPPDNWNAGRGKNFSGNFGNRPRPY
ncbi:histone deacetylase complex subunit SAP18 [Euwallacea fornicatus]|uniref:histone deacetylase complex subunit SAP18 n=1 Tax=Euwallacea fornicatus TaxID=995702 RepID=UPI00338E6214